MFKSCKYLCFQPMYQRNYLRYLTLLCQFLCANKSKGSESMVLHIERILTKLIIQENHYEFRTPDRFFSVLKLGQIYAHPTY